MNLVPPNVVDSIVRRMMEAASEKKAAERLGKLVVQNEAEGRSLFLTVKHPQLGDLCYYFVLRGGGMEYQKEPVANPTTTATMTYDTFLQILQKRIGPITAWKHDLMQFRSSDKRWLYHLTNITDMFRVMREHTGL